MRGTVKQLPSGRWIARYRDAEGRSHHRTFDRRTEATNFLNSLPEPVKRMAGAGEAMGRLGTRLTLVVTLPIIVVVAVLLLLRAL